MILNYDFENTKNAYSDIKTKEMKLYLADLQQECTLRNIPVIIIVEGWESSGKGYILNELTERLDTKSYRVKVFDPKDKENYIFTKSYWSNLPAKGNFAIYNRSSYNKLFLKLDKDQNTIDRKISYLLATEDTLINDETIIIKFFINISKETQRKHIETLAYDKYRDFMVTDNDVYQNLYYDKFAKHIDKILEKSSTKQAPWHIVNGENLKDARKFVIGTCMDIIREKLEEAKEEETKKSSYKTIDILGQLDMDKTVSLDKYEKEIIELQEEAGNLAYKLYVNKIPSIIVFEGVDAAGKGGAIRRLTRLIDARSYEVNPTSAPSDSEKDHHYLWRFYSNFPSKGKISIFDRSWYGRVMVERVEAFATKNEWERAYDEINAMEKELTDSGVILIKYFLTIDKDEQLKRFKDRERDNPYKLTEEDWRNRDKWDENMLAMNEMLDRTSTSYAPWDIIEGNQKEYARLEVLKIFIKEAKKALNIN